MAQFKRFTVRETKQMTIDQVLEELRNKGWKVRHDAEPFRPAKRSNNEHHHRNQQ